MISLIAYLNDDDKSRLKERRIRCWVQDRCAGLEGLEECADISAEREIVAEKNLFDLRYRSLLEHCRLSQTNEIGYCRVE